MGECQHAYTLTSGNRQLAGMRPLPRAWGPSDDAGWSRRLSHNMIAATAVAGEQGGTAAAGVANSGCPPATP